MRIGFIICSTAATAIVLSGGLWAVAEVYSHHILGTAVLPQFWLELEKVTIQACGVTVVGGFVAMLFSLIDEHRRTQRQMHIFREEFLRTLESTYRDVKQSRRQLRSLTKWHGEPRQFETDVRRPEIRVFLESIS